MRHNAVRCYLRSAGGQLTEARGVRGKNGRRQKGGVTGAWRRQQKEVATLLPRAATSSLVACGSNMALA